MKKIILSIMMAATLYSSTYQPTYAIFGLGDIVFDPAAFSQSLIDYAIQGYELAKETITSYSTTITATQQTLETINSTVLIPAASAMAVAQILTQKGLVMNLVLGSTGTNPLLIQNPEIYLKNKSIDVLNASIGDIAAQKNAFTNSVLVSVIANGKYNALTLTSKLNVINASDVLINEQKARCTDVALSAQAKKDVVKSDGTYVEAEYTARKREINNAICGNIKDPNVQAALTAVTKATPSWDMWLATTGGDNAYTKSVLSAQAIQEEQDRVVAAAKADLASGGGIKSNTKCVKRASADANGKAYSASDLSAPCILEQVMQTSNVISDAFKKALQAPVDILKSALAPGNGVVSLINTALTSYALINSISGSAQAITGGGSGGNVSVTAINNPVQDLANNPSAKAAIVSAPKEQLQSQKDTLRTLTDTDAKLLTTLSSYQSNIEGIKSCYENLVRDYPEATGRSQIGTAQSFYTTTSARLATKRTEILNEQTLIATTTALLASTEAKINASQSTQEILDLFLGYQNLIKTQNLPNTTAGIAREGDYVTFSTELQQSNSQGGQIQDLRSDCDKIKQDIIMERNRDSGGA